MNSNNNNNNNIKKESGSVERSPLFEEEVRMRNILLSSSQQSSNSKDENKQSEKEQNKYSSPSSTSSNNKKRKFCSINDETEIEKPLKKLISGSSIASSSSNESSTSSTSSVSSTSWGSSSSWASSTSSASSIKVHKIRRAIKSSVPQQASSVSSLPDYENCEDHEEYDENCNHCQKLEQLSREMANDRIILDEIIGEGSYGTVYSGSFNNQWVAIKIFFDEDDITDYENEIKYLNMLKCHPNVVQCKFSKKYGQIGVIVFELVDQSLMGFLSSNPGYFRDANNREKLVSIVKDIAMGIKALHSKNAVHVDLHLGNVLLDTGKFKAKLTDFGLSKVEDEEDEIMGYCPEYYTPPEAEGKEHGRQDHKKHGDIYQFGLILLNIIAAVGNQSDQTFNGVPESYIDLIMKCLEKSPAQRPSIEEIIDIINNW